MPCQLCTFSLCCLHALTLNHPSHFDPREKSAARQRARLYVELLNAGFRPCRRGPFVSAKVPKIIFARARPPGSSASAPNKMARELAPLKQPSPRGRFGAAAPPHPTRSSKNEAGIEGATFDCHFERNEKSPPLPNERFLPRIEMAKEGFK